MNLDTSKYLDALKRVDNPPVVSAHVDTGEAGLYIYTWRCVLLHELTEAENQGSHNVYIDLLTRDGIRIGTSLFNPRIAYGWAGMAVSEAPTPLKLEKPEPEPGFNFPLWGDASNWCSVKDGGVPSDTVHGLQGGYEHKSFYVVFQFQETPAPPIDDEAGFVTVQRKKVRSVLNSLKQLGGMAQNEVKELEAWLA